MGSAQAKGSIVAVVELFCMDWAWMVLRLPVVGKVHRISQDEFQAGSLGKSNFVVALTWCFEQAEL
jgi:hypothetical protein